MTQNYPSLETAATTPTRSVCRFGFVQVGLYPVSPHRQFFAWLAISWGGFFKMTRIMRKEKMACAISLHASREADKRSDTELKGAGAPTRKSPALRKVVRRPWLCGREGGWYRRPEM